MANLFTDNGDFVVFSVILHCNAVRAKTETQNPLPNKTFDPKYFNLWLSPSLKGDGFPTFHGFALKTIALFPALHKSHDRASGRKQK